MTGEANYVVAPPYYLPTNDDSDNKEVITKSSYYAYGKWWSLQNFPQGIPSYELIKNDVRGSGMVAITLATVGRYAGYDPNAVTLDIPKVRLSAARLICGCANSHVSNFAGGWVSRTWQAALWAFNVGLAAWMLWETDLTNPGDHERVAKMIIWEANRLLAKPTPFWRYPNDAVFIEPASDPDALPRQGDSPFEENAWNAMLLYLAHCMMPYHPNTYKWLFKAVRMTMAGSSVKTDLDDDTIVNGYPISHWVTGGYSLKSDYTVINHDIINPDYQQALHLQLFPAVLFALAGKPIPEALRFNARKIYGAMQTVQYSSGKTMYQYGTPTVYYPQGTDWGARRPYGFYAMDAFMDILGMGGSGQTVPVSASYWANLHLQDTRAMQSGRPGLMPGGQIVLNTTEDANGSREEWAMHNHASVALLQTLKNAGRINWTDETVYMPCVM